MFFQSVLKSEEFPLKFLFGTFVFLIGYFIGQIPLTLALYLKMKGNSELGDDALSSFINNPNFEIFGISSNIGLILLVCMFATALAGLYIFVHYAHDFSFKTLITPFEKINFSKILFGFGFWMLLGIIFEAINYFRFSDQYAFHLEWSSFLPLVLVSLFILPIQTTAEEILFRGYIIQGVGLISKSRLLALILSSIAFGAIHLSNPEISKYGMGVMQTYYISAGLFLGIMTLMDDSLELAIGVHAATNIFGAVFMSYESSAIQTDSLFKTQTIDPYMVLYAFIFQAIIFLAVCKYKYAWDSFNKLISTIEINSDEIHT